LLKTGEVVLRNRSVELNGIDFLGRIAVGKVARGTVKESQSIALVQADGGIKRMKIK
jgi:GTP-binding protein